MPENVIHRSADHREASIKWDKESALTLTAPTRKGEINTRHGRFVGGSADGVEIVEIDNGLMRVSVLPTRGMSVWKIETDTIRYGWKSPINGPIHPSLVPLYDPSGLGWLEGFDELVVRCGLESNGAPEHDVSGQLIYPLHGRIGNLAADSLSIEYDAASGRLELSGEVIESRLFFKRFRMRSRLRVHADSLRIDLLDDVTNELSRPAEMQMLYHINVGSPMLQPGGVLEAALEEIAPKDELSAGEIASWNQFGEPEPGFAERVYFARPRQDESGESLAMLRSEEKDRGFVVRYHVGQLPYFVLWKNLAAESDGYVIGIEPSTNFPNQRSFESEQGRVVEIAAGATQSFRVSMELLEDAQSVDRVTQQINKLNSEFDCETHAKPKRGWS